jgi:hypothetical protein
LLAATANGSSKQASWMSTQLQSTNVSVAASKQVGYQPNCSQQMYHPALFFVFENLRLRDPLRDFLTSIETEICLFFVFLSLQPILVVFSQPGSGL